MPASMHSTPLIVGIGGTTRANSSSEKALKAALAMAQAKGMRTQLVSGPDLLLEIYEPDVTKRSEKALALVAALRAADGLLIASPSYHGSLSGMLKNALDYAEDLREDQRPYFENRPVGCIVCADGIQAVGSTLNTLRSIIHALRGWPTPYAATISALACRGAFSEAGALLDHEIAGQLNTVVDQVVSFVDAMSRTAKRPSDADRPQKTALSA